MYDAKSVLKTPNSKLRTPNFAALCVSVAFLCFCGLVLAEDKPVSVELIAEHASIQPGGKTRIGVHFDIEPGWHIYAKEPGDAGLPTEVQWLPSIKCLPIGPLHWPVPERFVDAGDIRTYGYTGSLMLRSQIVLISQSSDMLGHTIPIRAQVKWLACKDICVPGSAQLELKLPVSVATPIPSTHAELFELTSPGTEQ